MTIPCNYPAIRDHADWNSKNLFLNFASNDVYQMFCSYLSLKDLASFSQASVKCNKIVTKYNPLGRCNKLVEFASLMIPFWDSATWDSNNIKQYMMQFITKHIMDPLSIPKPTGLRVIKSMSYLMPFMPNLIPPISLPTGLKVRCMFYKMKKAFPKMLFFMRAPFDPNLERASLVCSDKVKRHYTFYNSDMHVQCFPKLKQFHYELSGSLELSKIGCLNSLLSNVEVRTDYELLSLILFSTLEKISDSKTPNNQTAVADLRKHLEKLEQEGLKPAKGKNNFEDFKYEVLERAVWALLSKLYLVNIEPANMQEAEPVIRKLIRVVIEEIEMSCGIEVVERLAKTVELTFIDLEPLFDTAIRLAKQQTDELEKEGVIFKTIREEFEGEFQNIYLPATNAILAVILSSLLIGKRGESGHLGLNSNILMDSTQESPYQLIAIFALAVQLSAYPLICLYFPPQVQFVEKDGIRQKIVENTFAGHIARTATRWSFRLVNVVMVVAIVYNVYRKFM